MKRVCYGLAIPGLLASSVIFVHLSAKTVFVRVLRNTRHLTSNSWQHWTFWLGLVVVNTALAFVLAEGEYCVLVTVGTARLTSKRHPRLWRSPRAHRLPAEHLPVNVSHPARYIGRLRGRGRIAATRRARSGPPSFVRR